jgi:hypothetical protein
MLRDANSHFVLSFVCHYTKYDKGFSMTSSSSKFNGKEKCGYEKEPKKSVDFPFSNSSLWKRIWTVKINTTSNLNVIYFEQQKCLSLSLFPFNHTNKQTLFLLDSKDIFSKDCFSQTSHFDGDEISPVLEVLMRNQSFCNSLSVYAKYWSCLKLLVEEISTENKLYKDQTKINSNNTHY